VSEHALLDRAIDKQNRSWNAMQEIRERATAEGRELNADERKVWDDAQGELDTASADIDRFERERKLNRVNPTDVIPTAGGGERESTDAEKQYAEVFNLYMRRGVRGLSGEQRDTLQGGFSSVQNAQGTTPDTAGGYLIPEGWRGTLVETMKAFGGLAQHAEIIETDSGNDLPWPTNDDTANEGEYLAENTAVNEQDLTFGGKQLGAHPCNSKAVRVPIALLQDSGINLEQFIPRKLGERIGRRSARAWVTGTGVKQPQGITVGISTGRTGASGQTTSVIFDDLVELEHSIDPAYRPNGRYIFHDLTLKALRLITDGDDRPLWLPVPTAGFPATINGFPYTVDNSMPQMAASAKSIVFGDIRAGYVIRRVRGVQTLRLAERYADYLQVGFLAFERHDGMIQDTSAIKAYVNAAS
jgi:HK97 family phage major capsid protein